jgi:succinoglycan biosynthesis transport protein ExoP
MAIVIEARPKRADRGIPFQFGDEDLGEAAAAPAGALGLRNIALAIRANAVLIAAIIGAFLVLALIVTLLQTPRYSAKATIQINSQSDRVLGQAGDVEQESVNYFDQDRFLQTQLDILQSRGLAQRVSQRLRLTSNPAFFKAVGLNAPDSSTSPAAAQEGVLGALQSNLSTELPRNSRIASIGFTSADPGLSANIANAFADEFIASNLQRKFDSSAYARSFIADQLANAKTRLAGSEIALNNYARQNGLIRTRDAASPSNGDNRLQGSSVTTDSLLQLNEAANTARAARIAAEGKWQSLSGAGALNSPEVLSNPAVQQLLEQRSDVQSKLQQARAKYLPDHPVVIALRAQSAAVDQQLSALVNAVRGSVKAQYDAAADSEKKLEGQVSSLKTATLGEQDRSVQYNLLAREADTNRTIYDGLLQRFKELNAAAGISASNLVIIDRADPPSGPSSPSLIKNMLIALAAGLLASGLVVFLRNQFDDSIRVPEDIEQKLDLSLLGVVPRAADNPGVELADPKSPLSESYNSLGSRLLYATGEGLPETILVTSAQPTEGKSVTSLAIASNLARIGKRVVLIDLDLRRPSLHRNIGASNAHGMSTLLTSQDTIESVLVETGQERLSAITSGPTPPNPADLLASTRLQALIDDLADRFDVVVIDSPPVLGLADAPLLSALVDGVVMVIEAGRGRRGALKASLRRLRSMRAILLGAVLTKFDPKKAANRYSDYYGYDYYSSDAETAAR